jgi:hypothetical protein
MKRAFMIRRARAYPYVRIYHIIRIFAINERASHAPSLSREAMLIVAISVLLANHGMKGGDE